MSYCRWSCDDYRCDLYVYESDQGWVTHVAHTRYQADWTSLPAPVPLTEDTVEEWVARHHQVRALLDETPMVAHGLPHAGQTFTDATPADCADRVEALAALGYWVPAGVVETLRAEGTPS